MASSWPSIAPASPIRYLKVDADTGEQVSNEDIIKGYQVDKDQYLEVTRDELDNIALESTRTIDIDESVPRTEDRRSLSGEAVLHRPRRQGRP
jgi:non-homologous end joining protein Ku